MRNPPRLRLPAALAVLVLLAAAALAQPAARMDAILARPDVARGFWGVEVAEQETGRVLYAHDAGRLFAPASNAKLFVTAAALALLGPEYRYRTTVEAAAFPDKYGRITGDLTLVGRGDANLSGRTLPYHLKTERLLAPEHVLAELADQVAARGVRIIDGDLVADDSYFARERYPVGWSEGDLTWEYGAPVTALALNDNVVYLGVMPGEKVGEKAFLSFSPASDYYEVENRLLTVAARGPRALSIHREPGSRKVVIWGTIPLDDPGVNEALAIEEPADLCARLLRELLAKRGVAVLGKVRAVHAPLGAEPAAAPVATAQPASQVAASQLTQHGRVVLAEHTSMALSVDVTVTNKVSQNLHAEMMLRLLGRERGSGGSLPAGLEVLRGFLNSAGLDPKEYVLYDGCGLSRQNLVTPSAFVGLLRYAARQSWGTLYAESLPLAGVDGTLRERLSELPAGAVVRAKSGAFEHVNSLSGYLTTAAGRRLIFSIVANNHSMSSHQAVEVIDALVREAALLGD
jgi:D-alanyl-D-alanine carboxypeptidase/D-alanyl-D-alanine-endopeptidase (penicillin-binding protein 4)